jgi:hypothetical protein
MKTLLTLLLVLSIGVSKAPTIKPREVDAPSPKEYHIHHEAKRLCDSSSVSFQFVLLLGENESDWLYPNDSNYIRICGIKGEGSLGDLQIYPPTRKYYFNKLGLDTITRHNLLKASIAYIVDLKKRYKGDYTKVRYAYARGHWKPSYKWTSLEREFMSKADWSKIK